MPEKLPIKLFIHYFTDLAKNSTTLGLRAILVALVWLGVVPFITIWIWRLHIMFADNVIWLNNRFIISSSPLFDQNSNLTAKNTDTKRVWNMETVLNDCLKGWIIAFVVVLFFIVVILLKEWIQQNVPVVLDQVDHEDEEEEEEEDGMVPPLVPAGIPPDLQEFQTQLMRNRPMRARSDNRRPRLRNDPSDYENLEAMWQVDDPRDPAFVAPDAERYTRLYDDRHFDHMYDFRDQMDGIANMGQDMLFDHEMDERDGRYYRPEIIVLDDDEEQDQAQLEEEDDDEEEDDEEDEDDDDDDEEFIETDGILEAIGMRGKLIVLFQNSCLMILLIGLCIGVSVCFPLIMGTLFLMVNILI
jgi:E3 ubiquitin-protein ligase DOA10